MNSIKELKQKLEKHTELSFPAMPDNFSLWAEFVTIDADIIGEIQGIVGQAQNEVKDVSAYREIMREISQEATKKEYQDILSYLDSLKDLLDMASS